MANRLFISVFIILIASPLQATDYKAYPGSICQAMHGTQSDDIKRHASRGIGNYSNTYRWIVCPIIKDAVDEYIHNLEIWVYLTSDYPVECSLLASGPHGNTLDQDWGYGTGDTAKIHLKTEEGHPYGSWGIQCRLAPNAVLHSYLALEHADE